MNPLLRRTLQVAGTVLLVLGGLYACGMVDRGDRQVSVVAGSAETAVIRDRWAPGLGLALLAAGGFALWLGRRRDFEDLPRQ